MTQEQFSRELAYEITMSLFGSLLDKNIISDEEYGIIDTNMRKKYKPSLGMLYPQNNLIIKESDGNM